MMVMMMTNGIIYAMSSHSARKYLKMNFMMRFILEF